MPYIGRRTHLLFSKNETVCGLLLDKNPYIKIDEEKATCLNCTRKRSVFAFDNNIRLATRKRKEETNE